MQIWQLCKGSSHVQALKIQGWRIVEDQIRSSSRSLVDTREEHEILEKLLEKSKPYGDEAAFKGLHYLLFTPFRYPPLEWGSRFGSRFERNLFYASFELDTAIAEKAFHRFNLLRASEGNVGERSILYTAFKVNFNIKYGIDLSKPPFLEYREQISSPISYLESQSLGKAMRDDGVEACISHSARDKENGKNINVFSPKALGENSELEKTFKFISCRFSKDSVEFYFDQNFD